MTNDISAAVETFFSSYKTCSYGKGQVLILSGEHPEHIFYLVEGRVKQYDITPRGDEVIVNIFKPLAFFPMSLAVNDKAVNSFIYEADTAVRLKVAPAPDVVAYIRQNPDVLFDLLSRVYRGIDGLLGRMVHLMGGSARSRLIYELLLEAGRFGTEDAHDSCVLLSLHEGELGARAGLTRETVSRELRKLKEAGFVIVDKTGVHLCDLSALRKMLGQEV